MEEGRKSIPVEGTLYFGACGATVNGTEESTLGLGRAHKANILGGARPRLGLGMLLGFVLSQVQQETLGTMRSCLHHERARAGCVRNALEKGEVPGRPARPVSSACLLTFVDV